MIINKKQFLFLGLSSFLVLIPALLLVLVGQDTIVATSLKKVVYLLFSFAVIIIPLIIIKPKWSVLLNLFLTPLVLFELFNIYHFKAPSTEEAIVSLFFTNYSEATELASSFREYIYLFILILGLQFFIFIKIQRSFSLPKFLKKYILLFFVFIFSSLYVRDCFIANKLLKNQATIPRVIENANSFYSVKLHKTFPVSLFLKYREAKNGISKLENYTEITKKFKFNAIHQKRDTIPEIYVLVVGETARKNNFGLYGYKRNTSPKLEKIDNFIAFNNVNSSANITSLSIPHILTRATPNNNFIKYSEPAIINVFKEAGFKTYWLSNQAVGVGGVFGIYASLADEYHNIAISLDVSKFDEELFPLLDKVINDDNSKKFIIIHTIGSHFRYNLRYNNSYKVFEPTIDEGFSVSDNSKESKERLVNSYDNSILYTDFILSSFINKLKESNAISSLYYISDHGENLLDDKNQYILHGYSDPTKYEIEIPLFVWNSEEYINTYPKKDSIIRSNTSNRISTTNTFHTVIDIANINYPTEKFENSFANQKFDSLQARFLLKTDKSVLKLD